jgi:hypothetical protein
MKICNNRNINNKKKRVKDGKEGKNSMICAW